MAQRTKDLRPILKLDGKVVGRITNLCYRSDVSHPLIWDITFDARDPAVWYPLLTELYGRDGRWAFLHRGWRSSERGIWRVRALEGPGNNQIVVTLEIEKVYRFRQSV